MSSIQLISKHITHHILSKRRAIWTKMLTPYAVLFQVCLMLLASSVRTQAPLDGRHGDPERGVDFIPRKLLFRPIPEDSMEDGSSAPDYKLINKVLAQLNIDRQRESDESYSGILESLPPSSNENYSSFAEYSESEPENEQRGLRHLRRAQRHYPLCRQERNVVILNNEEFEYRPHLYEEIKCVPRRNDYGQSSLNDDGSMCTSAGFHCVQVYKKIHLSKRRYVSGCWEWEEKRNISAGCECVSHDEKRRRCIYNIIE